MADIVGRWAWDAFPTDAETLRQSINSFQRVLRSREPDIMALLRFDIPSPDAEGGGFEERYWSIIHSPVLDADGEVGLVLQHPIDVTELKRLRDVLEDRNGAEPSLSPAHSGIFGRAQAVHEANRSLVAETERLRKLFEQAPGFMALLSGPGHVFEMANDAYLEMVGRRDLLGKPLREALPEVVEQPFPALLDEVYCTGQPFVGRGMGVLLQRNPHGAPEQRHVDLVYQPLTDVDGRVWGIFVQGHDVTEQHRAMQALAESEARFRLMANAIPQIVWITDASGQVEFFNQQWTRYTGEPFDPATVAEVAIRFVHSDDRPKTMAAFVQAIESGCAFEVEHRLRSATGEYRWFLVRAAPYRAREDDRIVRWFGSSVDIHDRKVAEEALRESEQRFRLVAENVLAGQFAWDLTTGWITLPAVVRELFDLEDGPVQADRMLEKIHPDDLAAARAGFEPAFDPSGDGAMRAIYRVVRTDGSVRWVDSAGQVQFETLSDGTRRAAHAVGVVWEVTEQRQMVEALKEADQRKDEFLATLAHELLVFARRPSGNRAALHRPGRQAVPKGKGDGEMSNRFKSVWDAIEDTPEQAVEMRARAEMLRKLQEFIRSRQLTQTEVARRLGVTQPRVSDLMRGRIQLFSLDTLVGMLERLGVHVTWHFEQAAEA